MDTATKCQQNFCDLLGTPDGDGIYYDLYTYKDKNVLRDNITILFGQDLKDKISTLIEDIAEQTQNSPLGNVLMAIIFVLVTKERDLKKARDTQDYSVHKVLRIRKCSSPDGKSSVGCCKVFIDEFGQVYQNWKDFIDNNKYGPGTMIAPANGVYTYNRENKVQLEIRTIGKLKKARLCADKVAGVLSVAALYCPAVGSVAAAYTGACAFYRIANRVIRKESLSLKKAEVREDLISLAAGVAMAGSKVGKLGKKTSTRILRGTLLGSRINAIYTNMFSNLKENSINRGEYSFFIIAHQNKPETYCDTFNSFKEMCREKLQEIVPPGSQTDTYRVFNALDYSNFKEYLEKWTPTTENKTVPDTKINVDEFLDSSYDPTELANIRELTSSWWTFTFLLSTLLEYHAPSEVKTIIDFLSGLLKNKIVFPTSAVKYLGNLEYYLYLFFEIIVEIWSSESIDALIKCPLLIKVLEYRLKELDFGIAPKTKCSKCRGFYGR